MNEDVMSAFFMFGKYSPSGLHNVNSERTRHVRDFVECMGGKIREIYALLGKYDLVLIVEFPTPAHVVKTAHGLGRMISASFTTCPAVPIEEFDKMAEELETEVTAARMEAGE